MTYEIRLRVDTKNSTIQVIDSDGMCEEIDGYLLVIGGERCFVTSYGDTEAIAEGFANAYGTAKVNQEPFAQKLLSLIDKCISNARLVSMHLRGENEITQEEALEKFGDDFCRCVEKKHFH